MPRTSRRCHSASGAGWARDVRVRVQRRRVRPRRKMRGVEYVVEAPRAGAPAGALFVVLEQVRLGDEADEAAVRAVYYVLHGTVYGRRHAHMHFPYGAPHDIWKPLYIT